MRLVSFAQLRTVERRRWLFQEFDRLTRLPLLLLSLVMVAIIVIPFLIDLDAETVVAIETLNWLIYGFFVFDFAVKLLLAERRWHYIKTHPIDVLIVLLPAARPIRILQSARALHLLSALRAVTFFLRAGQLLRVILLRRQMPLVLGFTTITVLICAGLVAVFEENAGGPIEDYGDALWWSVTTITTVGYGDTYPVTPEGRGIALFLMLVGIAFFGVLTANLAAYFVESSNEEQQLAAKLDRILTRLDDLERRLEHASATTTPAAIRSEAAALAQEAHAAAGAQTRLGA